MQSTRKCEKVEVLFLNVLIRNQVFHKKFLLNALCAFLFNFLFSRSTLRFYGIYLIVCEICDKNNSNEKNEKLINCLFRIVHKNQIFRIFHFNKKAPLFNKSALGLSERQVFLKEALRLLNVIEI